MRVVIDARILRSSTGRYVERLLHYLQDIDRENEYLVLLLRKDFDGWEPKAPNFKKLVSDFPIYSFSEQLAFARQLYSLNADLVHFTMPQQPLLYFRPHVTSVHDLTLLDFRNSRRLGLIQNFFKNTLRPLVFKLALHRFVHSSREIITLTHYTKGRIAAHFNLPPERITVTYAAADRLEAQPTPYAPVENREFLLYVGNAFPYKNIRRLIEAFRALSRPELHLVLAGKKEFFYEELQRWVDAEKIPNVHITGFIPDSELAWLYRNGRAYVFPSLSEGFGLPALEAMQFNLPVASSRATCLPEVYDEAAHYFDPTDLQDMTVKISEVLDDEALRSRLIAAGKRRREKFSWARMAEQTLDVYQRALAGKK